MDVNRVIGEVAARHGVRLDPDDPALVLVTVAEIMLEEAREEFLRSARAVTAGLSQAERAAPHCSDGPIWVNGRSFASAPAAALSVGAVVGVVIFAAGVFAGRGGL